MIATPQAPRTDSNCSCSAAEKKRFTLDGDVALEHWLQDLCAEACDAVQRSIPAEALQGIFLGGGYGRGEGGVLRTPEGHRAYNDLEFYVFVRASSWLAERKYQPALHHSGEQLSARAGIEVEFKASCVARLRRSPPSMFYYDLITGHRRILGDEKLLSGCEHHRDARHIPPAEATRLLMNRCSGLLFARARLLRDPFTAGDADFVARNIAKAELALGDALLTLHGQYHWSCLERNRRLRALVENLIWLPEVQTLHDRGVNFKLHPVRSSAARNQLRESLERVSRIAATVWLWLESRRLQTHFETPEAYAMWRDNKCPEVSVSRSVIVNSLSRNWGRKMFRYPRDRVLTALPALFWCWNTIPDQQILTLVQSELRCASSDFAELVHRYQNLWTRVN